MILELPFADATEIDRPILAGNEPLTIYGHGPSSILRCHFSDGPAVRANYSAFYRGTVLIKDCTIESTGPFNATQHALEFHWPASASIFEPCVTLQNVTIRGYGLVSGCGWGRAAWFDSTWFVDASGVMFSGDLGEGHPLYVPGTRMFTISGRGAGYNLTGCRGTNLETLIDMSGDTQGFTGETLTALLCRYGVYAHGNGPIDEPQIDITRSHFNTIERGVIVRGMSQGTVTYSTFYANEAGPLPLTWFGIDAQDGADGLKILGNTFAKNRPSFCTGIAQAAQNMEIAYNIGQGVNTLAWLTQGSPLIGPNRIEGGGTLYSVMPGVTPRYVQIGNQP